MTVYADVVFTGNLISSLLLFLSVGIIFNVKSKWYRLLMSSSLCGIYAVAEAVFALRLPLRILMITLMSATAWGRKGIVLNTLRVMIVSTVVLNAVAGICALMRINSFISAYGVTVVANGGGVAIISILAYPVSIGLSKLKKQYGRFLPSEFIIGDNVLKCRLLYDSGNMLKHKNVSVAVMDWEIFAEILEVESYDDAVLKSEERMIYNTVSASGIMPVIKPRKAVIRGSEHEIYIGLTKRHFRGYDGVIGDIN